MVLLASFDGAVADTASATMRVTATVVQSCQELGIGASDSMGSSTVDPAGMLNVSCSRGRTYAVEVNRAQLIERGVGVVGVSELASHRFEVRLAGEGRALEATPATGARQAYALRIPGGQEPTDVGLADSIVVSVTF